MLARRVAADEDPVVAGRGRRTRVEGTDDVEVVDIENAAAVGQDVVARVDDVGDVRVRHAEVVRARLDPHSGHDLAALVAESVDPLDHDFVEHLSVEGGDHRDRRRRAAHLLDELFAPGRRVRRIGAVRALTRGAWRACPVVRDAEPELVVCGPRKQVASRTARRASRTAGCRRRRDCRPRRATGAPCNAPTATAHPGPAVQRPRPARAAGRRRCISPSTAAKATARRRCCRSRSRNRRRENRRRAVREPRAGSRRCCCTRRGSAGGR